MIFNSFLLVLGAAAALSAADIPEAKLRAFKPLPKTMESASNPSTPAKVELGRILYYENRISKSHEFSCNSCHMLDKYGVDNEPTSKGHKGQRGDRNSPTVYNAALHVAQFWDGRAKDVEEQAKGPVMNPVEMAMPDEKTVIAVLKSMPEYEALFKKAFPGEADPVTYDNMAKAIGAFERKLVTPARWDKFLEGDKSALSDGEKAGFLKFVDAGCAACHNGALLGGNKSLLFNAEYLIQIAGPVRLVLFYDAGQVQAEGTKMSVDGFKTSTGAEVRFFMPVLNVPFRLIFAYNGNREGVLNNQYQPTKAFVFRFAVGSTF